MSHSKVFMLQENTRFQTEAATRFGERVYLFGASMRSPLNPSALMDDCVARLKDMSFDSDVDFIAMTGPAVPMALMFAGAMGRYGNLRILVFDARNEVYIERLIEIGDIAE